VTVFYMKILKKNIETRVEKLLNLNDGDFKLHTGLKKHTFYKMLEYLTDVDENNHKASGRKGEKVVCKLVLAVTYWRDL